MQRFSGENDLIEQMQLVYRIFGVLQFKELVDLIIYPFNGKLIARDFE